MNAAMRGAHGVLSRPLGGQPLSESGNYMVKGLPTGHGRLKEESIQNLKKDGIK
jgi:hypothetical protein